MPHNNILRAPILVINDNQSPATTSENVAQNTNILSQEMQEQISKMIESAVSKQCKSILTAVTNDSLTANASDELEEESFCSYSGELDKIPDVVRCLRDFDGNPSAFSSWKKSVDRILKIYESTRGTPKYYSILNVIRNKIVGNADIVLESYNTPLNWSAISKCLTLHYADRRDISTLEFQLMSLTQGGKSVEEFYQAVYQNLSLILNKISCLEIGESSITMLSKTYRDKALDAFIRGLNGDLPRLLTIREPSDLPQALQLCMKLQNQNFRKAQAYHVNNPKSTWNQQYQQQTRTSHGQQFFPQLAYIPEQQNFYQPWSRVPQRQGNEHLGGITSGFAPPRPPKPIDRGDPMEIDPSMRTQRINYMNRPATQQQPKRPASSQNNYNKRQRNFNINTLCHEEIPQASGYDCTYQHEENPQNTGRDCTYQEEENPGELLSQDFAEIHFLE